MLAKVRNGSVWTIGALGLAYLSSFSIMTSSGSVASAGVALDASVGLDMVAGAIKSL